MNLYILRHGVAADSAPGGGGDAARPLTSEGEAKMWRITKAMAALELSFDMILSSPYLRARQTAEIVAEAFGAQKRMELCDALTPAGRVKELIGIITHRKPPPENVLLVGHEPNLSELISVLVSGDAGFSVALKKGGLCKLTVASLKPGQCAGLEWLLTPKQMGLMG
jgi:phosphohistidine phosphatase